MRKNLMAALAAFCAVVALAGCNKKQCPRAINPNPTFSMNIADVKSDWPLEDCDWSLDEQIAAHQQKVYAMHGVPDYFWIYWNRDGRPMTTKQFQTSQWVNRKNKMATNKAPDIGWMYLDEGLIFKFDRRKAEQNEVTDLMRTVTNYGDPSFIKDVTDEIGPTTVYHYAEEGLVIYFRDGKKYREQQVDRMEGFFDTR